MLFLYAILNKEGGTTVESADSSQIYMRYPGGYAKAFTMAFDDGLVKDEVLIDLFQNYGLKSTFYLTTGRYGQGSTGSIYEINTEEEATALYSDSGMEVGSHTRTHPDLTTFTDDTVVTDDAGLREEVLGDIQQIESQFGTTVYGIAYPGAPPYKLYNNAVIEWLRNNGVGYARTAGSSYTFDLPTNWLTWVPTCHFADARLKSGELSASFMNAQVTTDPMLFYVWGHAYELFEQNKITYEEFESFCEDISTADDVWFAANGEIYSYVADYNQLQILSANDTIINPTSRDLWFEYNGNTYSIKAGSVIKGVFAGTYVNEALPDKA